MFAPHVEDLGGGGFFSPEALNRGGMILNWGAALGGVISAFYEADANKETLRQRANQAVFEQGIANQNAQLAEQEAHEILQAGKAEGQRLGMMYEQEIASAEVDAAARGGVVGAGSSAAELAGIKLARDIDMLTTRINSTRQAGAARAQKVNWQNRVRFAGVSADNFRASSRTISRGMATLGAGLSGAAQGLRSWHEYSRRGY